MASSSSSPRPSSQSKSTLLLILCLVGAACLSASASLVVSVPAGARRSKVVGGSHHRDRVTVAKERDDDGFRRESWKGPFASRSSLTFLRAGGGDGEEGTRISKQNKSKKTNQKNKKNKKNETMEQEVIDGDGDDDDGGDDDDEPSPEEKQRRQNAQYIRGLMGNLEELLDKWIKTGTMATRRRAYNIHQQITRLSMDEELVNQATRLIKRAGMPLDPPPPVPPTKHIPADQQPSQPQPQPQSSTAATSYAADSDGSSRRDAADQRLRWEQQHVDKNAFLSRMTQNEAVPDTGTAPRSALSARLAGQRDPFLSSVMKGGSDDNLSGLDPFALAKDKQSLHESMTSSLSNANANTQSSTQSNANANANTPSTSSSSTFATTTAAELIARAGSGRAFEGDALGIGGLDDVLSRIRRRVWIPLSAPPSLLSQLGIRPVRGLLLHGSPGCGKTLLAKKLGTILSPARPITVVSGPEIMDKFVGSSEKNLRDIFDNPPEIYFEYKKNYGEGLEQTALHVIVLDEFDAIARARGGSGGKGDHQGDAGVARDSVVNQLLAKMDGMDDGSGGVPTLLIGLTNRLRLIDPALLRPGRFEVQIEVPKPKTVAQRVSILKVHTERMMNSGRVLARDAPEGSAAWRRVQVLEAMGEDDIPTYAELLDLLAIECDGMSGASLAAVARAAASRALERAVTDFAGHVEENEVEHHGGIDPMDDCLVTRQDFEKAIEDVFESARGGEDIDDEAFDTKDSKDSINNNNNNSNGNGETMGDESAHDIVSKDDTTVSDHGHDATISEEEEPDGDAVDIIAMDKPTGSTPSLKSVNLKSLLPERKITWRRLDRQGRKIEMDSEEMKYRQARFSKPADGVVDPKETSGDGDNIDSETNNDVAKSHGRDDRVITNGDAPSECSNATSGEGGTGVVDDAASTMRTRPMKSVNLKHLLPERKVTWMKIDRKGRRMEVDPLAEKSGMHVVSKEETVSDPDKDSGPDGSMGDRIGMNAKIGTEEDESEKGRSDVIPAETTQPIKSVNLKKLLPERKITWMKLDKKGRRIEFDPFAGNAGNGVDDITNEEMLSDQDVTSNQVKNEDESESSIDVTADKQAKEIRVEPTKRVSLQDLLPERKITWMKLDEKGRRIEVDPYSSDEVEAFDGDGTAVISHASNEESASGHEITGEIDGSVEEEDESSGELIVDELTNEKRTDDSEAAENVQPIKSVNLKSLLPARKITWMKLDKKGRRIEVDLYSGKNRDTGDSNSSIVGGDVSNEEMVSDHDITRDLVEPVEINDALSVNMILDELASREGTDDAKPKENIQPMRSVNLKNLLPVRRMTWMKLDKKGRRIEVDPNSGIGEGSKALDSGVVLNDITHEEMVTDLDVTRKLVDSVETTDEFSVKMILDEVAPEEGIEYGNLSERIQPIKSANLQKLLPTRKIKWMKLDKKGRRIEVDPYSEPGDDESNLNDTTAITSDSTEDDMVSDYDSDVINSIENEHLRSDLLENDEVMGKVDAVEDPPPIKSVNLKSLLPARKMIWMNLDKKGRRIEAVDLNASSNLTDEVENGSETNEEDTTDILSGEDRSTNEVEPIEDNEP